MDAGSIPAASTNRHTLPFPRALGFVQRELLCVFLLQQFPKVNAVIRRARANACAGRYRDAAHRGRRQAGPDARALSLEILEQVFHAGCDS